MKKILVVLTGGTIGSKVEGNLINVNATVAYRLISMYNEIYHNDTEFEVIQPLNVLSENMTPVEWNVLIRTLMELPYDQYEGVIITHGTDTLSYTSALIGYLFHHVSVPIVMIASNYALGEPKSNGLDNFRNAICFIKEGKAKGVFTVYRNEKGDNEVYLATRIVEADTYNDQFTSYGGEAFGKMLDGRLITYETEYNPSFDELNDEMQPLFTEPIEFQNNVMVIKPYPGLDYRHFDLSRRPKAILHHLYHSSTGCIGGQEYSLLEFIQKCNDMGIDFYVTSFKNNTSAMYSTSKEILEQGAKPLFNISAEAAYIKLLIQYNQTKYETEEFMKKNLFFESLPEKKD